MRRRVERGEYGSRGLLIEVARAGVESDGTLDSKSPDRVDYQSREAPRGAPQLIVDVAP